MKLGISGSHDIGDFDFREYFLLKNLNFRKFAKQEPCKNQNTQI